MRNDESMVMLFISSTFKSQQQIRVVSGAETDWLENHKFSTINHSGQVIKSFSCWNNSYDRPRTFAPMNKKWHFN